MKETIEMNMAALCCTIITDCISSLDNFSMCVIYKSKRRILA